MHVAHAVHEPARLLRNGVGDAWIAVPGIRDAEGRGRIEVTVAVDVGNGRAVGRLPEHRKVAGDKRYVSRFVRAQARGELRGARARNFRDEAFECFAHVSSTIQRTNSAIRGRPPCKFPKRGACNEPNGAIRAAPAATARSNAAPPGATASDSRLI